MGLLLKHILPHSSGRLSYRRVIPEELRRFIPSGKREHKESLGHEGSPGFLSRYEEADKKYDKLVATARRQLEGAYDLLDGPRIASLVEVFRIEALEEDDEARWSSEERELYQQVAADLQARGMAQAINWRGEGARRWADKSRETTMAIMDHYRDLRGIGDIDGIVDLWREDALELLEAQGLIVDPNVEEPLRRLCRALNDVAINVCGDKLRRLDGEVVDTPVLPASEPLRASPPPPDPRARPGNEGRVPMLETFDAYAAAQGLTPGVRVEWRRYIELLIGFLGHDDAARLTTDRLRDWRDKLLSEPTRRGTPRQPVTVRDKYITPVRAMLAWAVEERKLPTNVATGVVVRVPKKARLRDPDFTVAEATAILKATLIPASPRFAPGYVRAQRWIPWLCAYTGARVNEFSQLRGEDVQEIEGIWTVRITPEAGTVKANEARIVPLHSHLIEQGFIDMVSAHGSGPLFYDPSRQRVHKEGNRHFKKVGERLAEWVRKDVGISDPELQPNHAWRHTFKTQSYEVDIEERVVDAIQGHAAKTTGRGYGKPSLKALAAAVAKIPRFEVPGT